MLSETETINNGLIYLTEEPWRRCDIQVGAATVGECCPGISEECFHRVRTQMWIKLCFKKRQASSQEAGSTPGPAVNTSHTVLLLKHGACKI